MKRCSLAGEGVGSQHISEAEITQDEMFLQGGFRTIVSSKTALVQMRGLDQAHQNNLKHPRTYDTCVAAFLQCGGTLQRAIHAWKQGGVGVPPSLNE